MVSQASLICLMVSVVYCRMPCTRLYFPASTASSGMQVARSGQASSSRRPPDTRQLMLRMSSVMASSSTAPCRPSASSST
jgi:hypothetical protein